MLACASFAIERGGGAQRCWAGGRAAVAACMCSLAIGSLSALRSLGARTEHLIARAEHATMGRKGGGRAGFVKAARSKAVEDDPEEQQAEPEAPKPAPEPQQPAVSKAAAFLKDEPAGDASSDEDDEGGEPGAETRGKMLQRHKREQKALKDQVKRLGKKGKDEAAKLEAEMAARHAAELASIAGQKERTAAEAVAVADSLYSVHLGGEGEDEAEAQGGGKKQSKSQRRREQRQREEAEREARIAAELAEIGETDRMVEERELQAVLRPLGLTIHQIPPDGHCLYRSLEDQLQRLPEGVPPPPAPAEQQQEEAEEEEEEAELNFLALRQRTAEWMRRHAAEFKPFVLEEDAASVGDGDDAFEAYCREIEATAAWGGQVELQALAQALQSHIVVYSVGLPVLEMGEQYQGTGRTLRLCYLRHAYGLGEHYESVVPGLAIIGEGEEEEEEGAADEGAAAAAEGEEA